jgi:hypothetical protein
MMGATVERLPKQSCYSNTTAGPAYWFSGPMLYVFYPIVDLLTVAEPMEGIEKVLRADMKCQIRRKDVAGDVESQLRFHRSGIAEMIDARWHVRIPARVVVAIRTIEFDWMEYETRNIGYDGIFVHMPNATVARNDIVDLCFDSPSTAAPIQATVVRRTPDGIALRFCNWSDETAETLSHLMEGSLADLMAPEPVYART